MRVEPEPRNGSITMVAAVGEVEERVYEHGGQLDERVILQDAARYPASERSALWDTRQRESLLYRPTIAGSASSRDVDEIHKSPNPGAPRDARLSNCMSST